jgi:quercetin dioxygenase-like cupin family protein
VRRLDATPAPFGDGDPRFTGPVAGVHLAPDADPTLHVYAVSFAAGARTAWHAHDHGQLLICTAGAGQVGDRHGAIIALSPGTAVWTEPGEEHWHGAGPTQPMTHLAVQTAESGGDGATWAEPVPNADESGPR